MWLLVARQPVPDVEVWPGRPLLAAGDAVAWPVFWAWALQQLLGTGGIIVPLLTAMAVLSAFWAPAHGAVGQPPLPLHDLAVGQGGGRADADRTRADADAGDRLMAPRRRRAADEEWTSEEQSLSATLPRGHRPSVPRARGAETTVGPGGSGWTCIRFKTGTRLAPAKPRKRKSQQAPTC